ncbi:Rcn1p LALA0_S04e06326g [Lachancea lanzarotensis]|uniref:LALA0S04e06326g1_1 n=1 Tax=Lachancea lanzarotensis TaxID=1245769 RepID=A0A0C7N266_9SACH|nr:uncharacterized protein LALA0_S04e06326g [Lachancea lanzarotensis]CEP62037.1 LALA0S04e06326g1_1 [Lachancea lanzarotensis]
MVSNTVIITAGRKNATETDALKRIREFLEAEVLQRFNVTEANPLKLVALPTLNRCILVCPSLELAEQAVMLHSQWPQLKGFQFRYSALDAPNSTEKQFLELPKQLALFLVSPPTSPPPGFDFSRLEEAPNRVRGLKASGHVPLVFQSQNQPQQQYSCNSHQILLNHSHTPITLDVAPVIDEDHHDAATQNIRVHSDGVLNSSSQLPSISQFRTAVPPRSIFDDVD